MRRTATSLGVILSLPACGAAAPGSGGDAGSSGATGGDTAVVDGTGDSAASSGATSPGHDDSTGAMQGTTDATEDTGSPPPPIAPCEGLPSRGQWEAITPPYEPAASEWADGFSEIVLLDPHDPSIVFVTIGNRGLFRSEDCGASWSKVNVGEGGEAIDDGNLWSGAIDPNDGNVLFAVNGYGAQGIWKSADAGVSWTALLDPTTEAGSAVAYNFYTGIAMDPHDAAHLVATPHAECDAAHPGGCLLETFDGGASWAVRSSPLGSAWAEGSGPVVLDGTSYLYATQFEGLWLTEDNGSTWAEVTAPGAGGASAAAVRGPEGELYVSTLQGVTRSDDDGRSFAMLPDGGGRLVALAASDVAVFAADQWSATYRRLSFADPSHWEDIAPPAELAPDAGAPYLAYDRAHGVLYSSNFVGGLWRIVIE